MALNARILLSAASCSLMAALALAIAGCETDKEKIDAQNSAARTAAAGDGTAEPTRDTGDGPQDVSVFDLRVGDCLTESAIFAEDDDDVFGEETETEVISCDSDDAFGRVSKLHLIEDDGDYPGDDAMFALAEETCAVPGQSSTYYTPTGESWDQGDRAITCIDLIAFVYTDGACIAGEDEGYRTLPCDADPDRIFADVVRTIDVTPEYGPDAALPPESRWDEIFDGQCAEDADYFLYPTAETWEVGDRLVVCVLTR